MLLSKIEENTYHLCDMALIELEHISQKLNTSLKDTPEILKDFENDLPFL